MADNVINELVKHITPPKGQTEVPDARHKKVYETVNGSTRMIWSASPSVSKSACRIFLIPPE